VPNSAVYVLPGAIVIGNIDLDVFTQALWAKTNPYHPLWCHLLDTGAVCERLLDCFGCPDDIPPKWVIYLSALHDIGKADPEFQVLDDVQVDRLQGFGLSLPSRYDGFRHESRSGVWMGKHLRECGWSSSTVRMVAATLRAHHGNFTPKPCAPSEESPEHDLWEQIRDRIAEMLADTIGIPDEQSAPAGVTNASATGVKLIGLNVLSDWIASNEELFRYPSLNTEVTPSDYWQQARTEAARAVSALQLVQLGNCITSLANPSFRDIWPQITSLRSSQQALEDACRGSIPPGLAIIEAPMGEGKTESAIYLSECWKLQNGSCGAYIALPTMATSNQMHGRYREFLRKRRPCVSSLRLVHGMSWLVDDVSLESGFEILGDSSEEENMLARDWFNPSKRALIAPEGVGTIDQALMAALNVKHGFLRLLGLSSKVLIVDEVHAYDEYMTTILERLLEWCRVLRIPVIMLSATLSQPQKLRLINAYGGVVQEDTDIIEPYPLITIVPLDGSETRVIPVEAQTSRTVHVKQHLGKHR